MMNDNIKKHFRSYAGNTDESLAYLWTRLQKCESLADFIPVLKEYDQVQKGIENNFVKAYVNQAEIISKSIDSAAFLMEHGGADLPLIDLWKAKYDPDNASKIAVDCMTEYSKRPQQVTFAIKNATGEPCISLGYKGMGSEIIPEKLLTNSAYTVQWLYELVKIEYNKMLFLSNDPDNLQMLEAATSRTDLIQAAYNFKRYEALPLPDWSEITGAAADSVTVESVPSKRKVYYREIAYWLICEESIIDKATAKDKYDRSKFGISTAKTRGQQLLDQYSDLENRRGYTGSRLRHFIKLQNFVLDNFELSDNGRANLLKEKQEMELRR